jgi:hypothetical protein
MTDLMSNRITVAVSALNDQIAALDEGMIRTLEEQATLDPGDWADLGEMPSRALLYGKVTAGEAQALHAIHSTWSTASLAERVVFLQAIVEALG